ncbi:MAG: class III poly(R)-hydroxyalkanoic acid synthase subunit PhaE [Gammaproteobacteria bacterium]
MNDGTAWGSPWGEDWMVGQRQFWETWTRLYQQSLDAAAPKTGFNVPWAEALAIWEKAIPRQGPDASQAFLDTLVRQGKGFLSFGEEFTRIMTAVTEGNQAGRNWQELLQNRLAEMKKAFTPGSGDASTAALFGMLPFFELPLDTWRRTIAGASLLPGDFLQPLKPDGRRQMGGSLDETVDKILSVPGVGYTREWQEQAQGTARLVLDYQKALHEYLHAHGRLGVDTVERFSKKVLALGEEGKEIHTLRALYDLWVDAGEEAYNDLVFTESFSDIYARLVNALMALKRQNQNIVDEAVGALNLPTRKGLNTMQCRQQEMRRELRALRSQVDHGTGAEVHAMDTKVRGLEATIAKLSERLAKLVDAADSSTPAAKPAAMRPSSTRSARPGKR